MKKVKRSSAIFWIFSLLLVTSQITEARERRAFYEGVRGRSMGGAQIAVVNDETALLINPAGLGKLRNFYGTVFDPELEISNNVNSMSPATILPQAFTLSAVKERVDAARETYYHAKAQVFPSLVAKNFGIGIFSNYITDAEMNIDGTNMDLYYRNDMALVLGYNFRFFDGRIKLGFNTKVLNRIELNDETVDPTANLDDLVTLGASEGTGVSTDVGLIMTAPWAMLPTISAVVHDIGGTKFNTSSGLRLTTATEPTELSQDVDVALALFPIHSNTVRSTWTIEYRGLLTSSSETDPAKLLHAGMEFNIHDILFLRAGYNQRYYTAGFEIASERFQFQVGTFGEEIGDATTPREDRRTVFKLAYRF